MKKEKMGGKKIKIKVTKLLFFFSCAVSASVMLTKPKSEFFFIA
jgi:hypothetical protein